MLDLVLQQAGVSEPGFARKTVKWAITCTADGRYTGVVALAEGKDKGRTFDGCASITFMPSQRVMKQTSLLNV